MSEYREALQRLVNDGHEQRSYRCEECNPAQMGKKTERVQCPYHAAKALLARGEPEHDPALTRNDLPQNLNRIAADIEYCAQKVNPGHEVHGLLIGAASALIWLRDEYLEPAAAEKALRNCLLLANRRLHKGSTEVADWESIVRFCSEGGVTSSPLRNAAAEKAREPMHEGFPVDTIVRDIFTDKVGTIVSYHCRFEVEWADGSNSMDVHSRQLDHCGPQPSPPAATGEGN